MPISQETTAPPAIESNDNGRIYANGRTIDNYEPDTPPAPHERKQDAWYDLDAEYHLAATLMVYPEHLDDVLAVVTPDDLSVRGAAILTAVVDLARSGDRYDAGTVALRAGDPSLTKILDSRVGTPASWRPFAEHLGDLARRRRLAHSALALVEAARTGDDAGMERAREHIGLATTRAGDVDWEDVGAVVRGEYEPLVPEILERSDGKALIYPGLTHWLMGEPGKGKTWIALAAVAEQLCAGRAVMYLDWEGNRLIVGDRLRALDVDADVIDAFLLYARPKVLGAADRAAFVAACEQRDVSLCVYDGVAKALGRQGFDEDRAADVLAWLELAVNPIAETGAACLLLDHVAKDRDGRGLWARGSGAKLGEVTGASWVVKPRQGFSREHGGSVDLVQAKDREGHLGADGQTIAHIAFMPGERGALTITVRAPDRADGPFRPTGLMESLSRELEQLNAAGTHPSQRSLVALVRGKRDSAIVALERLVAEGYVERTTGPNRSQQHVSARPFRQSDDQSDSGEELEPAVDF